MDPLIGRSVPHVRDGKHLREVRVLSATDDGLLHVEALNGPMRGMRYNVKRSDLNTGAGREPSADVPVDWSKPNADLTDSERKALHDYGWDQHSYEVINANLRSAGSVPPEYQPLADEMAKIIDKASLPADATLYRHTYKEPSGDVDLLAQLQHAHDTGGEWTDNGFMSTSLNYDHADDMDAGLPGEGLKMEISAPKGAKALVWGDLIADEPGAYDQEEVTLQRGSRFRVDSVGIDENGTAQVRLTLLGSDAGVPDLGIDEPGLDSGTTDRFTGPMEPTDAPDSPDFGFPPLAIDPQVAKDHRISSNADIRREVDHQVQEYDADESSAIENVADWLGLPFAEVQARYYNRSTLLPPDNDRWPGSIQRGDTVRSPAGRLYKVNDASIPANAIRPAHRVYDVTDLETGLPNAFNGDEISKVSKRELQELSKPDLPPVTDNGGAWTVVTRPNKFGPFQKTGFGGSWQEASDHARLYPDEHSPWIVGRDDTEVSVPPARGYGKSRSVKIAPTREERAAAKAEEQRIQSVVAEMLRPSSALGSDWINRTLVNDAGSILGMYDLTPREAAEALARAGWDRRAIMNRHS